MQLLLNLALHWHHLGSFKNYCCLVPTREHTDWIGVGYDLETGILKALQSLIFILFSIFLPSYFFIYLKLKKISITVDIL